MTRERPRARALRLLRARLAAAVSVGQALAPERPAASIDKDNFGIGQAMAQLLEERIAGRTAGTPGWYATGGVTARLLERVSQTG